MEQRSAMSNQQLALSKRQDVETLQTIVFAESYKLTAIS